MVVLVVPVVVVEVVPVVVEAVVCVEVVVLVVVVDTEVVAMEVVPSGPEQPPQGATVRIMLDPTSVELSSAVMLYVPGVK